MSGIAVGSTIFALLMVLLVLRVPIGIAMFTMGAAGYVYLDWRRAGAAVELAEEPGLCAAVQLRPGGDPAVSADGPVRHARRA